ncbi:Ankyrin repeat protein [Melia azedarach]|uniref:Ankyrin repeat protein n=1 Tax=Melia azedarach TaxID=155640 RepID=A0ACC1YJ00_MELAZ|nr:Ankyrin repeat protein [Melia azedarach]
MEMCTFMASKDPTLVAARNKESETPLFSAALHGKKTAFLCLHSFNQQNDGSLCRKSNGDTILHSAISGEYYSLAFQIIHCYPDLVDTVNENGLSPLHILASKSNAFKSSSCLGIFDLVLYNCVSVDELRGEEYVPKNSRAKGSRKFPENYRTCMNFFKLIRNSIHVLGGTFVKPQGKLDEENPHQKIVSHDKEDRSFPPNCNTIVMFSKLIMKALLIILGIGYSRISTIREKKVRHKWANLVMNELVQHASIYKYEDNGQNPASSRPDKDGETFVVPGIQPVPEYTNLASLAKNKNAVGNSLTGNQDKDDNGEHQSGTGKQEWIVHSGNWTTKGTVHCILLLNLKTFGPSSLIPGAALQMQWETKWYKFVKESMPPDFFDRYNNQGKTPKEIFTETHKHLVKEGSKWLAKPPRHVHWIAALIATVAFATSATVPGHYLVVRDELRSAAYPIYAATCLPATLFVLAQVPLYFDLILAVFRKVPKRSYKVF